MILAIDLGSTRFKASLYSAGLAELSAGTAAIRHTHGEGGRVEIPVPAALAAFREAVGRCLSGSKHKRITKVALTSQAQTFTIVDSSGVPRIPFISWQDARAGDACESLARELACFGKQASFGSLLPALQISQLRRISDTEPHLLAAPNRIVHLSSFFVRLCTGENVVDENLAAMTGLYSIRRHAWWEEALAAAGVSHPQLSRVIPIGASAGKTLSQAARFGLPAGIPVVLAGNDQTAGAYGAQVHKKGSLLITLGTAQVAYLTAGVLPPAAEDLARGPYPHGRFYRMAADLYGGNLLNWARDVLADCGEEADFFARAAHSPPGCRGVVFEPDVAGGHGAWKNLGYANDTADLARAVVEALCRRMAAMVRRLGVRPGRVNAQVAGGGAESPVWRGILAETLGVRLERTHASALLGAARMALEHRGRG